ncbi:MAG: mandelate racemase/muconate lactonizing enzyme family protein [Rhizobiales bacterium]|nr:mandelate racemase/muconate lactonizing enzyme family protein [Rhizobacter sp.]
MKITEIRCHLMQAGAPAHTGWTATGQTALAGGRNWLFVTVHTDAGLVGTGEGSGWPRVVATAVDDLAHLLIGEEASDIERLGQKLRTAMMGHGQTGTVGMGALAAIDMALWDLKGLALETPVANLLGGLVRQRVPYYCHAADVASARAAVERGVRGIKVGGLPGIVERAFAIRAAVGPEVDLMVDLHGPPWLNAADAVAIGRALEPLNLLFLEDPVAPDNLDGWRRVRDQVALPLAAGERLSTLAEMRAFIDERLLDVLQPDTGRFGGLTQMRKLAGLAEAHGLLIAPHSGSLGPVAEFAAVHLLASIPNALLLERMEPDWPGRASAVTSSLAASDGHLTVPTGAGLGVRIDTDFVAAHPSERNASLPGGGWNAGTEDETLYLQARRPRAAMTRQAPKATDD